MVVKCPYCHVELESEEDVTGQKVQCPQCEKKFVVGASSDKRGAVKSPGFRNAVRWLLPMTIGLIAGVCVSLLFRSTADSAGGKECYKLKFPAVVEKLGKDGVSITEPVNLKAGTVLAFVCCDDQQEVPARLQDSGMSHAEFTASQPHDKLVFEAKIKLSDYYNGLFSRDSKKWWSVTIGLPKEKIPGTEKFRCLYGYVRRDSEVGKKIFEYTRGGAAVHCMVEVSSTLEELLRDQVYIEDFCPL